jgi:PhoPQ-activated pathogenicity-related protein
MFRSVYFLLAVFVLIGTAPYTNAQETALDRYIAKPDPNYRFFHYATDNDFIYKTYFLHMTSQQWRSSAEVDRPLWEHTVMITVPLGLFSNSPETAILLINGGNNGGDPPDQTNVALAAIATTLGVVVATVEEIPNQPLFFTDEDNRKRTEDEILAYSLDKYLDTGDEEWPVHLPMTKAVVRAMDTVQSFLDSEENLQIDNFIVIGGSKRGWTTWLTAAVDSRVRAIAPASIDMLNLDQQFLHHWQAYGFYTPAIRDYVEFDIPCRIQTPQGQSLLQIIDPYEYRDRYTMRKFIANATGDQFFLPDSSQFYYSTLSEPKLLRYTPNTDHKQNEQVILSALAWMDDVLDDKSSPQYSWSFQPDGSIRVQAFTKPDRVRLWQARNPYARDFRLEAIGPAWTSSELQDTGGGVYVGFAPPPAQGWAAFLVELTYDSPGELEPDQVYTTDVRVTPDTLPFAGTECTPESKRLNRMGLYNPANGQFEIRKANAPGMPDISFAFGSPDNTWRPVVGDWNGDGFDTVGLYQPDAAAFHLRNVNEEGDPDISFPYGPPGLGWLPVAGDWDGDGVDTIGLYDPATATFHLRNSNSAGFADIGFAYGPPGLGWLPVVGDWNGDGIDTVGLYRPDEARFYLRNSNTSGFAEIGVYYGPPGAGWLPVVGDWDGDGTDTVGLYRPDTATFLLRNSNTSGFADIGFTFGPPGEEALPIAGHWQ